MRPLLFSFVTIGFAHKYSQSSDFEEDEDTVAKYGKDETMEMLKELKEEFEPLTFGAA